jgi:hypothetical protein
MVDSIFDQTISKASTRKFTRQSSSHSSTLSASNFLAFICNDGDKSILLLVFADPVDFLSDFPEDALWRTKNGCKKRKTNMNAKRSFVDD